MRMATCPIHEVAFVVGEGCRRCVLEHRARLFDENRSLRAEVNSLRGKLNLRPKYILGPKWRAIVPR